MQGPCGLLNHGLAGATDSGLHGCVEAKLRQFECFGHENGFEHLVLGRDEVERDFDLGVKFEECPGDQAGTDTNTGLRSWGDPYLALYVSARTRSTPRSRPIRFQFGLTRSKWQAVGQSSEQDRDRLLRLATERLESGLHEILAGTAPEPTSQLEML